MSLVMPAPIYTVRHGAALTTAEFLIEVRNAGTAVIVPLQAWCSADTDETNVQLRFRLAHYDTQGATGTSLTIDAHQAGFAAAASTAVFNPGTDPTALLDTYVQEGSAIIGPGFQWDGNGLGCVVAPSNSLVFELLDAPPASVNLSFGLRFAELR